MKVLFNRFICFSAILITYCILILLTPNFLNNYGVFYFVLTLFYFSIIFILFRENKLTIFLSLLLMFLICGLREPKFVDDLVYKSIFYNICENPLYILKGQEELGYLFLNFVISIVSNEYIVMQSLFIGVGFLMFYKALKKNNEKNLSFYLLFFYFFVLLFRFSGSGLNRMQFAVFIFIYALQYLYEKNYKKYSILVVVGSFFHRSILITLLLLVYPFVKKLVAKEKRVFSYSVAILIFSLFFLNIAIPNLSLILGDKYLGYSQISGLSFSTLDIFYILVLIYFMYCSKLIDKTKKEFYDLMILSFIIMIIINIFFSSTAFGRIIYYFIISLPILIALIQNSRASLSLKVVGILLFFIFCILYFVGTQLSEQQIKYFLENYVNYLISN